MRILILNLLILVSWSGAILVMAQLPPEILADSYLLRAEQAIRDGDKDRARAEIDKIILLQKEPELDLSEEFHFRYAKTAAAAALPEQALEAVVKYLTAVGREGQHYVEALELMNQAQDEIAGRKVSQADSPLGALEQQKAPLDGGGKSETILPRACGLWEWDSSAFFRTATVQDVKACLAAGADVNARGRFKETPLHDAARSNENPEVVQALLAAGADVNARDITRRRPCIGRPGPTRIRKSCRRCWQRVPT